MALDIRPLRPEETRAALDLLARVFHLPPGAPQLDPRMAGWKYFDPRPDYAGCRSWAAIDNGRIVAHCGIWPLGVETPDGVAQCVHLIDWAADPESPGAGVLLYRELIERAGMALVLGGSMQARKLLGRLGFRTIGTMRGYARVERPLRQWQARPARGWKDAARLARNWRWSLAPRARAEEWSAAAAEQFPDALEAALREAAQAPYGAFHRAPAMLNYMLRCPAGESRAFLLYRGGELRGYFLLARMAGQTRIADLRIAAAADADWTAAFAAAERAAAADPRTHEVTAGAFTGPAARALCANGFQLRAERPVWLYDPAGRLAGRDPHLQPLESDSFFFRDPGRQYLT